MQKADFLNTSDFIVMALKPSHPHHPHFHPHAGDHVAETSFGASAVAPEDIVYYEWVDKDKKWGKLNDKDPDPPKDLAPGTMDGQITEVYINGVQIP